MIPMIASSKDYINNTIIKFDNNISKIITIVKESSKLKCDDAKQ